jgi:hypothetical protein
MKDNTLDDVWVTKPSNVVPFSRRMVGEFSITIYNLYEISAFCIFCKFGSCDCRIEAIVSKMEIVV